jgi:hypothetical protein
LPAAVQGIDKTSIQCPCLPDSGSQSNQQFVQTSSNLSASAVYKNVAKNPPVDIFHHKSFPDIHELAVVPAIAPHSHGCYM